MVTIVFESHGTTLDNEAGLSSGWFDVDLSPLGERQAKELGERYSDERPDVVFCSDLKRSWRTAELAFGGTGIPIIRDARLRECDYGEMTRRPSDEIDRVKGDYITTAFPGGKSYTEMAMGMKAFLLEVSKSYEEKIIMIIGSRATQYGLEHWIVGVPLHETVVAPWKWQPGWRYTLSALE